MAHCDEIDNCSFFRTAIMEMPTVAEMMKNRYCHGDFDACARKSVLNQLGKEHVPANLAPNDHDRAQKIIDGVAE